MGRAPCCDKANVKKGPWSPEEDAKLKSYIEKHGTGGSWIALPHKIGLKRCGKSCRLRWLNYLRPNIRHGGFSGEEDNIICSLYVSIGSRWSIIASQLPGRTDNDIKNYWNTRLKKKLFGKQLCKEPIINSNCNYMMKKEVNINGKMSNSLLTFKNNSIDDDMPNESSSSLCEFLVRLNGGYSNEDYKRELTFQQLKKIPSLSSHMDYNTPPQFLQTQVDTDKNELSSHGIQGQTQITSYNDEFLYSDSVSCGESNSSTLGYFTSLMALPPPPSRIMQQDSTGYRSR